MQYSLANKGRTASTMPNWFCNYLLEILGGGGGGRNDCVPYESYFGRKLSSDLPIPLSALQLRPYAGKYDYTNN